MRLNNIKYNKTKGWKKIETRVSLIPEDIFENLTDTKEITNLRFTRFYQSTNLIQVSLMFHLLAVHLDPNLGIDNKHLT